MPRRGRLLVIAATIAARWPGPRLRGQGGDVVCGGAGDDLTWSDHGADRVDGGTGDDRIWADSGDDGVEGGGDVDRVDGGTGLDACLGAERTLHCEVSGE